MGGYGPYVNEQEDRLREAASKIDLVEAFTPPPDCDMSVGAAREAWPDKILWCNFPSSVHITADQTITETTRELLRQAAPGERFLIGVTEDIPETHMWRSLGVINERRAVDAYNRGCTEELYHRRQLGFLISHASQKDSLLCHRELVLSRYFAPKERYP